MIRDEDLDEIAAFADPNRVIRAPILEDVCRDRGKEILLLVSELRELRKKSIRIKITENMLTEAIDVGRLHQKECGFYDPKILTTCKVVLRQLLVHGENDFDIDSPEFKSRDHMPLVALKCAKCGVNGVLTQLYVSSKDYRINCRHCFEKHGHNELWAPMGSKSL